jgi:hypothetical protein
VVTPHLFTPYHYQSFTSTHNTHTPTCVSTTQPIPQTHAAAPLSRGQISIRKERSQAAPPCEHSRRAFTNYPPLRAQQTRADSLKVSYKHFFFARTLSMFPPRLEVYCIFTM